jgi:hypothetical protein
MSWSPTEVRHLVFWVHHPPRAPIASMFVFDYIWQWSVFLNFNLIPLLQRSWSVFIDNRGFYDYSPLVTNCYNVKYECISIYEPWFLCHWTLVCLTLPHIPSCLAILYPFMAGHWPDICPIVSGADRHLLQVVLPAQAKATLVGYVSVRNFSPVMKSPSSK